MGMFDSGAGGLTVLREIHELLPWARISYLGDTARVPCGKRSLHTVTRYALESVLLIACNTASALSLGILKRKLPIGSRFLGDHITNVNFVKSLDYQEFLLST